MKIGSMGLTSLAKRLDVPRSTLRDRSKKEDFPQWTQEKDPERIAWKFNSETKLAYRVKL